MYPPHVQGMRTGQALAIKTSDPTAHNVHGFGKVNRSFNRSQPPGAGDIVIKMRRDESHPPMKIKCDIHPWMNAYHLALDHPWGTATSSEQGHEGEFRIENVPVGEWKFRVWHEKTGGIGGFLEKALTVKIEADKTTTIDQEYPASRFQR